ncbi:terpene synthase 10 isoform X2 [Medicago truncatula]|uniref:Monoterpene synthase n=1 Tax=Medicago truncatula TaxID=3880 RepID=A0A072V8U9_MEDTR|nr:terpene synthase 10 isoform X2 [Medicago truncatula]KEH38237.1 monoterpene synthase [Medicago truncatula]
MVFPILGNLPFSFAKNILPPLGKKYSSLATCNFNTFSSKTQCKGSYIPSSSTRRSANFQPSIWTYDYIQSLSSEYKEVMYRKQCSILKEKVRMMLNKTENELTQLELIDVLQRLGVSYHFNNEIRDILDNIYNKQTFKLKKNLHATAHVIVCFEDEICNFKNGHFVDVEGMLSLYEASFHLFEDEPILDEARDVTSKFLKEFLDKNGDKNISLQISHALELPLHWGIPRWEARWFIDIYERQQNKNHVLLEFAQLDFNILQSLYQEDLKYTSRWWKRTTLGDNLSFARDRLVENFVWTVGTNFKPEFDYFRKVLTKVNSLITIIDDVYDVYGTLEELELFTKAIDRWDLNAMDSLPNYMKMCFHALYDLVNELAFETLKKCGYHITPYLKKAWADLCKSYLIEAKWYHSGYTPSLGEYLENAWISISAPAILTHAYFVIPHSFKIEDLVCLEENSDIIRLSAIILRLANDLGTYKRENETGDIPKSIQCYMNETGASEVEACEYVKSMMFIEWKKMNKEAHGSSFSQCFIDTAVNLARMALFMYHHGDGHTIQAPEIKNRITSLVFQPIPNIFTKH